MNYRHGFHAGNFADVVKHAVFVRILAHLALKPTPFRVIDTHAGEGVYDLRSAEAERTGEWREGIGRLARLSADDPAAVLLRPYREAVGPCDAQGRPPAYPGSPALARRLMRDQDRAIFCETRVDAFSALRRRFARDRRIKTLEIDAYKGLNAFTPPPERRGVVLIDPPFEAQDECDRMRAAFAAAYRKWPTGIYALWYPIKDARARLLPDSLAAAGATKLLALDCAIDAADTARAGLARAGLIVVNPPYTLEAETRVMLPALVGAMERRPGAGAFAVIARGR